MADGLSVATAGEAPVRPVEPVKASRAPKIAKSGAVAEVQPARLVLVNNGELRRRRQILAEAVAQARRDVETAETRWRDHAHRLAREASGPRPFSATLNSGDLAGELERAKAELAAQEAALALVDGDLAVFDDPARRQAAADGRKRLAAGLEKHCEAIERLERLVKGRLRDELVAVFETKRQAAAEIGATTFGALGDMAGDTGLRRHLSELIGGALHGLIDANTLAFYAGNGIKHDRRWSDCEMARLGNLNIEALE